jgi:hypothetical protein
MKKIDENKPVITNNVLLLFAGIVWEGVGILLLYLAYSWLSVTPVINIYMYTGAGAVLALLVHHFGFLKIVDKNLQRIIQMKEKKNLFSFMPWKSYLLVVIMITMGAVLRHSVIPKRYLAIVYIGIGLALILSSVRYIRTFVGEINRQ